MLTRGTLWAAGKLTEDYLKPEPVKKERINLALGKKEEARSALQKSLTLPRRTKDDGEAQQRAKAALREL